MNKNILQTAKPVLLVFIFLNAVFLAFGNQLAKKGVDKEVLIMGNLVLFIISIAAFLIMYKALLSSNPQAFVRAMYGNFMIKFFVLAIIAFIYIMIARKEVNKPALVACAGMYIIYTSIEIRALLKLLKQKSNA